MSAQRQLATDMNKHQRLAIDALNNMRSGTAAKLMHEFRNYSDERMQHEYSDSGKTCAELLAEWKKDDADIDAAIMWVKYCVDVTLAAS